MNTTIKKEKGKLLFLGFEGKKICDKIVENNYTGFSLEEFNRAYYWLENQVLVNRELPKAIISDLYLGDSSAFAFYNRLKSNRHLKHIPFIVLTPNADKDDKARAMRIGIDDFYLGKFDANSICDRIEFLAKFKAMKAETEQHQKPQINLNYFIPLFKMPLIKRLLDITLSLSSLVLLSPLFLLIAILIKLESKGSVLYVSKRAGTGYRIFNFYKFRSMREGAENELNKMMHLNKYAQKEKNAAFSKFDNDPRTTKIGRLLRLTSLDELPQLINVLIGDMSLVGNRPLPLYEAEQLTKDQWAKRFLAPAGITGLWQITTRSKFGKLSDDERMELDIAYVDQASIWFDIKIIFRTFPALFQREFV